MSMQTRACLEHSHRGKRPRYSICQSLIRGELQGTALDSFGSYLGWYLEHTGHAVTTLTKKLCLKSNLASLAILYPLKALQWTLLKCSVCDTHVSITRVHFQVEQKFPDCQGLSVLCKWESGRQWRLPQALGGEHKCLSTYLGPRGLIHGLPPFCFPLSKL